MTQQSTTQQSTDSAAAADTSKKPQNGGRYRFAFRFSHWVLAICIPLLFLTGLSLHIASRHAGAGVPLELPEAFVGGRVYFRHWILALCFAPMVVTGLICTGYNRAFCRKSLCFLLGGGAIMILTGAALLYGRGLPCVYPFAQSTHAVVGMLLIPLAYIYHAVTGLTRKNKLLVPSFHPWKSIRLADIVLLVAVIIITDAFLVNNSPVQLADRTLKAKYVDLPLAESGGPFPVEGLSFDDAEPLDIHLASGIGFNNGRTTVTLRAMYDDDNLFILAEWDDITESRGYQPWVKTEDGWRQNLTIGSDEHIFYEDKFSLIFPIEDDPSFERFGCATQCHLGKHPESDYSAHYGYKGTDSLTDVWHWKGSRTGPFDQLDDKYWDVVDPEGKNIGRHGDPKDGGGYTKNITEDKTRPLMLPRDADVSLQRLGVLPIEDAVEYSDELAAQFEPGDIVEGIFGGPFEGDRGDVRCVAKHHDGQWHLYIQRKLDTGHTLEDGRPSDRKFEPGVAIPFGCAAFDHASKRHAYTHATYWLELLPK